MTQKEYLSVLNANMHNSIKDLISLFDNVNKYDKDDIKAILFIIIDNLEDNYNDLMNDSGLYQVIYEGEY